MLPLPLPVRIGDHVMLVRRVPPGRLSPQPARIRGARTGRAGVSSGRGRFGCFRGDLGLFEPVECRIDVVAESIDVFRREQPAHEQGSVMPYSAADVIDGEILASDLRDEHTRPEVLHLGPRRPGLGPVRALERIDAKFDEPTLDPPVAKRAICLGQVLDRVDRVVDSNFLGFGERSFRTLG